MMPGISIRVAGPADVDQLIGLTLSSPETPQWSIAAWRDLLSSSEPQRVVLVAGESGAALGFCVASLAGEDVEMESLAVSPAVRRRGLGRRLCQSLLDWSREHGASRVLLEVRVSNMAARSLYRTLGFQEIGMRRLYYRQPDEDAVVMALERLQA